MTTNKNLIITALDITRQLFTWDNRLHKDVFTRHLKLYVDQLKLTSTERSQVLHLIENVLYVVTDKKRYTEFETSSENQDIKLALERIYDVKTSKNVGKSNSEWWDTYDTQVKEKDIAEELFQLKVRLHEEILSVKTDIKLCKQFVSEQFQDNASVQKSPRRQSEGKIRMSRTEHINKLATPKNRSGSTSQLNPSFGGTDSTTSYKPNNLAVRKRGSKTSLYEETNISKEPKIVNILLGDFLFDQISNKKLYSNKDQELKTFCKANSTIETGFDKVTDFVIQNPEVEIETVCILLGANNIEQKQHLPPELAINMMSHIKDLLKRISGHIYVYTLPPRLDDAAMDRKAMQFNAQLSSSLYHAKLQRVTLMQSVVPRETRCFQKDGLHLAGPGLNKMLRAIRQNMA